MRHTTAFWNPFWLDAREEAISQLVAQRELALQAWALRTRLLCRMAVKTAPRCGAAAWSFLCLGMGLLFPGLDSPGGPEARWMLASALGSLACALALLRERARRDSGRESAEKTALLLSGFTLRELLILRPLRLGLAALAAFSVSALFAALSGGFTAAGGWTALAAGAVWVLGGLLPRGNREA